MKKNPYTALKIIALICLTLAIYFPVLKAGFIWEDHRVIENNLHIQNFDGLRKIWTYFGDQYYPLQETSYLLEFHLWGGVNAFGFHLDNIILHTINALLLWLILWKLGLKGSWLIALIFAVHPVHVESVAWLMERKNVLYVFFIFVLF